MLAAHLRDHPNIKHDNKLLGNCDLYMGYSPKIYAIDLFLSLSHSWSGPTISGYFDSSLLARESCKECFAWHLGTINHVTRKHIMGK